MKPPARYRAYVHKDELGAWMLSRWDVDGERAPKGDLRPICWRHAHDPKALPLGWERAEKRVWQ